MKSEVQEIVNQYKQLWVFHEASIHDAYGRSSDVARPCSLGYMLGSIKMAGCFVASPDDVDLSFSLKNMGEGLKSVVDAFNKQVEPQVGIYNCIFDHLWAEIENICIEKNFSFAPLLRVWAYTGAHDVIAALYETPLGKSEVAIAIGEHCGVQLAQLEQS